MRLLLSLLLLLELSIQAQIITTPGGGSGGGGAPGTTIIAAGADLAASINSLANGATLLMGVGTFSITASNNVGSGDPLNAPIRLLNKTNVTIRGSGMGTKLLATGSGQAFLVWSNCQNLIFSDLTVDGNWSGYTSNGLVGAINGAFAGAGTNNNVRIQNCRFQNIGGFAVLLGYRGTAIDNHYGFQMLDCTGYNLGVTNTAQGGIPDGGLFAGGGDNMTISRIYCTDSVKVIELFPGIPVTNITLTDISGEGNTFGFGLGSVTSSTVSGVNVANISLKGGTNFPVSYLVGTYSQEGMVFADQVYNVIVQNAQFMNLKGPAIEINVGGTGNISNLCFSGISVINGGTPGTYFGGVRIQDNAGGNIIDTVAIRNSQFVNVAAQTVDIDGGRNITVENCSFLDCGNSALEAIRCYSGFDVCSNIVIRNNLFRNIAASRASYAVTVDASSLNVRITDNVITNMTTGAILDNGGSTTIIGEPFSYSSNTNLASLAAGVSAQVFVPAALCRTNWTVTPMIPASFYMVAGGGEVSATAFGTNGGVRINIVNNGAGAFDPPDTRFRVIVRANEGY